MHEHLHTICELNELLDDVNNRLTKAGFGHFLSINKEYKPKIITALNALLQNQYDATDKCFQFEEYKFLYGLKDIHLVFGLPINGRPIHCESLSIDEAEDCRGVPLADLNMVSKDPTHTSDTRARARATLLIIIGSVIAPGPTENYVHIKHLLVVQNLDEVHLYSWGAAYLASMHEALSSQHKKLYCSLLPVYVSLFLPFPRLKELFNAHRVVAMMFPL
ncbi:hypothetical protein ACFE04_024248 [Oxalis oulophora]